MPSPNTHDQNFIPEVLGTGTHRTGLELYSLLVIQRMTVRVRNLFLSRFNVMRTHHNNY